MKLRVYQLPFLITLIAMPVPWPANLPGIGAINWLPEMLALLCFAYLTSVGKINLLFPKVLLFIVLLFSMQLVVHVLMGQGIGGSAIISVILMTGLYYSFFRALSIENLDNKIISQVSIIYGIHVCFILIEILLLNTGHTNILMALSNGTYKSGYTDFYGLVPQSLSNQSQATSQFCAFAAAWFAMQYLSRKYLRAGFGVASFVLLVTSLVVFAIYPTTTMLIVVLILLFFVVYLIPFSKRRGLRFFILILSLVAFKSVYEVLSYKFTVAHLALSYQSAFTDPVDVFFQLPLFDKLWGMGSISIIQSRVEAADLGIGIAILQVGAVLSVVAITAFFVPVLRIFRFSHNRLFYNSTCFPWLWLGCVNALLAIGNFLSLFHYTVSLQAGGRALFSFHIAIVMLSLHYLIRYNRSSKMTGTA